MRPCDGWQSSRMRGGNTEDLIPKSLTLRVRRMRWMGRRPGRKVSSIEPRAAAGASGGAGDERKVLVVEPRAAAGASRGALDKCEIPVAETRAAAGAAAGLIGPKTTRIPLQRRPS